MAEAAGDGIRAVRIRHAWIVYLPLGAVGAEVVKAIVSRLTEAGRRCRITLTAFHGERTVCAQNAGVVELAKRARGLCAVGEIAGETETFATRAVAIRHSVRAVRV